MSNADAWLDDVFHAGGDSESPLSPNIPTYYLPKPRKGLANSSPGKTAPIASPVKRKRCALSEIDLPNERVREFRETCLGSFPPKRQRPAFAESELSNMAYRSRSPKKKGTTNTQDVDENAFVAAQPDATVRQHRPNTRMAIRSLDKVVNPPGLASGRSGKSGTLVGGTEDQHQREPSIDESADSKNSKRSLSPTKRMVDLRVTEKRIAEKGVTSPSDVPSDVQSLHLEVQTTGMSGYGIVPMEIKV